MPTDRLLREPAPAVRLLEAYVRMLCEDDGYGDLMAASAEMSPYGVHFGDAHDLYNVFVRPFTDVLGVAAGKTKELSQKAQTLGKVAFEAVATTLVPVLRDSYAEIFAKEQQEVERVKQEYAQVYQRTWDAFKDHDALCAAFMYSPVAFLTLKFADRSPKVVAKLLSVLTGGELDPWLRKVSHAFGWDRQGRGKDAGRYLSGVGDMGAAHEGLVREASHGLPDVGQVLTNRKVVERVRGSDVVRRLEQDGKRIVRDTLKKAYEQAAAVAGAKDLADLQRRTGAKIDLSKLQQVPQQERQKAEQALLAGTKKAMKDFYVKNLTGQVEAAEQAGVPGDHPYVRDYRSVIGRIKAL